MEGQFQILFEKMKIEMKNQNEELKESITRNIMDKMDEKLIPLVEENKNLKIKLGKLEREIEYLKRSERNNNIIVFGLEEMEKSSNELIQNLKKIVYQDLNISIEEYEVNKIHRLGIKNREGNKPRPVLCSFLNNWKRNEILKNKKNFKSIYITEDYPKEVLDKRKDLQVKLIEERKKGNTAFLKYDKLIVKENNNNLEKKKREPSVSPSSYNNQQKKQQALDTIKSNRANAFDIMRSRSSSLSNVPNKNKNQ